MGTNLTPISRPSPVANETFRIRPWASVTVPNQSQRTPKLMVSREVAFQL
jgi:hypothetical protein